MYRLLAAFLMLFLVTSALSGQEDGRIPVGMIGTAEGRRLSIFREGDVGTYDAYLERIAGLPVLGGSLVQLEENTSVELQLLPGTARVKLAAQATIRLEEVGDAGGGRITAYFGRLRVVVPSAGGGDVVVEGPDARVTIAPGSDVAVDVLADPDTAAVYTSVSTIAGTATLGARPLDPEDDGTVVAAGTRARTVPAEAGVTVEASGALDAETAAYWARRAFVAEASGPGVLAERFPEAFAYVGGFYEQEPRPAESAEPPAAEEPAAEEPTAEEPAAEEPAAEEPAGEEDEAEEDEADDEAPPTPAEVDLVSPESDERDRTELRNGGLGLMVMGAVFAGAGYGVDYAADAFFSEAVQPEGVSPGTVMMYAGGGFFATGLITLLVSQF